MELRKVSLISPKKKTRFLEEIQKNKVFFSFATKFSFDIKEDESVYEQTSSFFVCRDFLGDCLFANWKKERQEIYKFSFAPLVQRIQTDKTTIVFKCGNFKFVPEVFLSLLHEIEEKNNFLPSELSKVKYKPNTFIIEGDPKWQSSLFLISFYSFIIKSLVVCPCNKWREFADYFSQNYSKESYYWSKLNHTTFEKITKNLSQFILDSTEDPSGFQGKEGIHSVHNRSGWVYLISNNTPDNQLYSVWTHILFDTMPAQNAKPKEEIVQETISESSPIMSTVLLVDTQNKLENSQNNYKNI